MTAGSTHRASTQLPPPTPNTTSVVDFASDIGRIGSQESAISRVRTDGIGSPTDSIERMESLVKSTESDVSTDRRPSLLHHMPFRAEQPELSPSPEASGEMENLHGESVEEGSGGDGKDDGEDGQQDVGGLMEGGVDGLEDSDRIQEESGWMQRWQDHKEEEQVASGEIQSLFQKEEKLEEPEKEEELEEPEKEEELEEPSVVRIEGDAMKGEKRETPLPAELEGKNAKLTKDDADGSGTSLEAKGGAAGADDLRCSREAAYFERVMKERKATGEARELSARWSNLGDESSQDWGKERMLLESAREGEDWKSPGRVELNDEKVREELGGVEDDGGGLEVRRKPATHLDKHARSKRGKRRTVRPHVLSKVCFKLMV